MSGSQNYGMYIKGPKVREQSDGSYLTSIESWLPSEMFHPHGNYQATTNDTPVLMDFSPDTNVNFLSAGEFKDLSKYFAPLKYGAKLEQDTGLKVKVGTEIKDARELFAKMGTVPIPLELTSIPQGDFNCKTYLFTYMDTSGSMNSVLPAARAAVTEIRKYFKAIYYGTGTTGDTLAAKYIRPHVNSGNEQWLSWFAGSNVAGQAPHNAVSIAFINESNSVYHPGHPTGTYTAHKNSYISNFQTWQAGGGTHQSAVMGMGAPTWWSTQFSQHVLDAINNDLEEYNVQGFMGLDSGMGSAAFVDMIVDWLNIPQNPSDLACNVTAVNDQGSSTTVKWNFSDYICGVTGTYDPSDANRFQPTMDGWKFEIATDSAGSNVIHTSATTTTIPNDYTHTQVEKLGAKFWARLTAVGATGVSNKSGEWVLCRMSNQAPVVSLNGAASVEIFQTLTYNDPGISAVDDHDLESALNKETTLPTGFAYDTTNTNPGTYTITYKATDTSGKSSTTTREVVVKAGQLVTSTPTFIGFTDLGWEFVQTMQDGSAITDDGNTTYTYQIATQYNANDPDVFQNSITQTLTRSAFQQTIVFNNLTAYTTYYARVLVSGDLPGVSNITSQYTDPCADFSATRVDNGDNTVTLTIKTAQPSSGVFLLEDLTGGTLRGLVRPVADDQFGNLFIASGEGLVQTTSSGAGGKLVFDGGFPKFYDSNWSAAYLNNMFATDTPGQWPYMVNAIKYASGARGASRTNKVVYINDAAGGNYNISVFDAGINGCVGYTGKTMSYFKDSSTDGSHKAHLMDNTQTAAQWKTYLDDFDCVVWVGTETVVYTLATNFVQGLLDYFDGGGGLFVITDHNSFQVIVNQILPYYGVRFTGLYNRNSNGAPNPPDDLGGDAYKISTILANTTYIPQGVHPLFQDMAGDSKIPAGASEGEIIYDDDPSTGGAFTSSYVSNAAGDLTITTHNNGQDVGYGKLIIRTANDCGEVFELIT